MTLLVGLNTTGKKPASLPQNSIQQNTYFESCRQDKQQSSPMAVIGIEEDQEDEDDRIEDVQFIIKAIAIICHSDIPPVETHSRSSLKKKKEIQFYLSDSSPPFYMV